MIRRYLSISLIAVCENGHKFLKFLYPEVSNFTSQIPITNRSYDINIKDYLKSFYLPTYFLFSLMNEYRGI
uniref:Uncharacterized protein n=1 Tax=Pararge aegeria TaxID=116150 RepID=S4NTT7_9NEOP